MKDAPGSCHLCPALKSFLSDKVSGPLSYCNSPIKYKKLDQKFEKKMIEAIKHKTAARRHTFKSINSIIMRFPQFKEGLRNIQNLFEQYDVDSNGTIDHEELKKCLSKLQIHLSEKEIDGLYHYCDVDGNEGIQYNEFIVLLCLVYLLMEPATNSVYKLKLNFESFFCYLMRKGFAIKLHNLDCYDGLELFQMSRMGSPQLEATFDTLVDAFLFIDKNGDGKLNKKDMIRALNGASPWEKSPTRITTKRFKEMDWNKNGKVSFREFLFALTKWVGIDTDAEEYQKQI